MFEFLLSAQQSRVSSNGLPIFDLDFGPQGKVELYRRAPPDLLKGPGILGSLLLGDKLGDVYIQQTVANTSIVGGIKTHQEASAMVVAFFNAVIGLRRQFQ